MRIFSVDVEASSEIEASPAEVWAVLADFSSYKEWNPLATKLKGKAKVGSRGAGMLAVAPKISVPFFPKVITADANEELRWKGGAPILLMGDHRFIIEPSATGCALTHKETFHGLLVPLIRLGLKPMSKKAYKGFNAAIHARTAELASA